MNKIAVTDAGAVSYFAESVGLHRPLMIAGARGDDIHGSDTGSAYVFDVTTGEQVWKLTPKDPVDFQQFGKSVAISDRHALIGAYGDDRRGDRSGAAYVFDLATGEQLFKLQGQDTESEDQFGFAVDLHEGVAIIGAPYDRHEGVQSGSAYLFDVETGAELAKLVPVDGASRDLFGASVAVRASVAVVGARVKDEIHEDAGAAYVFDLATGEQRLKLLPDTSTRFAWFGSSVALNDRVAVVGARGDLANGTGAGAAYVFDLTSGVQLADFTSSDGAGGDAFGASLAIDERRALVGALGDDGQTGAGYFFELNCGRWLDLHVDNVIGGQSASVTISNGTPGSKAITLYGFARGFTPVTEMGGYCALFGIGDLGLHRIIGGTDQTFDTNGLIQFEVDVPEPLIGERLFVQSAERSTCPDAVMSNLVERVVQ